jgi:DNA-binding response OmpR family regulator
MVVADDHHLAALLRVHLERAGFRVLWVRSAQAALAELRRGPVSLVVLDRRLPGNGATEVCHQARGSVPIVVPTARDGAPFSPGELVERVRAELRQAEPSATTDVVTLGEIRLSRSRREVWLGEREVALTPKEFDLLAHLVERPGIVVSRRKLLEEVWGFLLPGATRTVEVHVGQVRKKLGDPSLIRTVRGVGYKAVAA